MNQFRAPVLLFALLCTACHAAGLRVDETVASDLMIKKIPGEAGELLRDYAYFMRNAEQFEDARIFLRRGEYLVNKYTALSEGGRNLKATVLLMHLHDWIAIIYRSATLPIESAIAVHRFAQLCSIYTKYCSATAPVRARLEIDHYWESHEKQDVLGIDPFYGQPLEYLHGEAEEARKKYRDMLDAGHERQLDGETRALFDELWSKVEEAYKHVIEYME